MKTILLYGCISVCGLIVALALFKAVQVIITSAGMALVGLL